MCRADKTFDPFVESTVDGIIAGAVTVKVIIILHNDLCVLDFSMCILELTNQSVVSFNVNRKLAQPMHSCF